jgi:hypothetical protein
MVLPSSDLQMPHLKKQSYEALLQMANTYGITFPSTAKKNDLLLLFEKYIKEHCFVEIKPKNASTLDLVTIGKNIKIHFTLLG